MRFDGKVVLISGAGSGIGRATARGFGARGAQVAVSDIDRAKAEAVTAEIIGAGGKAVAIAADVGTPAGASTSCTTTPSASRRCPRDRAGSPSPASSTTRCGPTSSTSG